MHALADLIFCLRFFTRLPIPAPPELRVPQSFTDAAVMAPVAGALIGLVPAFVLGLAIALALPPLLAAPLAIVALVAVTGALHEDGLADCADGFGGGATRERKLDIMRDSRIGTFGACAIAASLYIRALAIGALAMGSMRLTAAALVLAASLSRAGCLLPLLLLPPARSDGLGAAASPKGAHVAIASALAFAIGLLALPLGLSLSSLVLATMLAMAGSLAVCGLASRQIGGQTGDVAGAAQQIAEIAVLLVFAASAHGL